MLLVSGATGYIGQHLMQALDKNGTAARGFSRAPRPAYLHAADWVQGDITQQADCLRAVQGCRAIIHLACLPLPQSAHNPLEAFRVNALGTAHLLEAARQADIAQFIFASSVQVYGGHAMLPNREDQPLIPHSPYAASKICAETWCAAAGVAGFPVLTLRLFNVYGPAVDHSARGTVESLFLQQIVSGQRPRIQGNPQNGRDFIHTRDVVRAFLLALQLPLSTSLVLNIGSGRLTTLSELAQLVACAVKRPDITPEVIATSDFAEAAPQRFQADTCLAEQKLGFKAQVTLEDGLLEMVARAR